MKITIITDNEVSKEGLLSEWGFSALVEVEGLPRILFDTGATGSVLMNNIRELRIDPDSIDSVIISHNHWDHTGGLNEFLRFNSNVKLYLPVTFDGNPEAKDVIRVKDPIEVYDNIYTTGELSNIEQSLLVKLDRGIVIVVGCSHPGVDKILESARNFGKPVALIGGLHGFNQFKLVEDLDLICATHCTQHKERIKGLYPDKFVEGGSGKIIEI